MLEELTVRNLALSALSEVSFKAGLNCVTGETGAGKSLIVDALSLIVYCQIALAILPAI